MNRISIVGSGWLGRPLAVHLQSLGYQVRVSTTRASRLPELVAGGLDPEVIDITCPDEDFSTFLEADVLICAITSKDQSAFMRLVRAVEASTVRQVLFISSTSVYPDLAGIVREGDGKESESNPLFRIEKLFQASEVFTTTVLRFGGLFGPGRHPGLFFRRGGVVLDPNAPVNLIHLDDCIGIISAIIRTGAWGEVFNACAETHPTKREFYSHATRLAGMDCPGFRVTEKQDYKVINNRKLRTMLGYGFIHPDLIASIQNSSSNSQ
jgi:nucleoside-diphosphate-sugar epimerase